MKKDPFLTEEEAARQDMAYQMTLDAASQDLSDARLAYSIAQRIKYQLPIVHQRYVDMEAIYTLSNRIAELVGNFDIMVMPFDDLMKVLHEQPGVIIKIGLPNKKSPFALIDEKTRVVGVYVPKKPRLVFIEREAQNAVASLNDSLLGMGAILQKDVAEALKLLLASYDHFPFHIPEMRIIPRAYPLSKQTIFTKMGKEISYQIKSSGEAIVLEYFVLHK